MSVLTVAGKELRDHIENKRFLIVFGALLLVIILSMNQGIDDYSQALDNYKEVTSQTAQAESETIRQFMPEKPSILLIFNAMLDYFIYIGAVLGVIIWFDLISKEKEEGSLKSLLSHPLHRDTVIIGKLLGVLATFGIVMLVVTFISIGFLMIYGIIPTSGEFLRIIVYMLMSLVFLVSLFSIAIFCSVIAKSSGLAIAYCISILLVISFMLPTFGETVADHYAGDEPQIIDYIDISDISLRPNPNMTEAERAERQTEMEKYNKDHQEYWQKKTNIESIFDILAPDKNYEKVSDKILFNEEDSSGGKFSFGPRGSTSSTEEESLAESLSSVWPETLSILMLSLVMLIGAYIKFMRMDLR